MRCRAAKPPLAHGLRDTLTPVEDDPALLARLRTGGGGVRGARQPLRRVMRRVAGNFVRTPSAAEMSSGDLAGGDPWT